MGGTPAGRGYLATAREPPRHPSSTRVKSKRFIHFEFDQEQVKEPLLYRLSRTFADVEINIRGASVTPEGGFVALELQGEPPAIERVLEYLRARNITVIEDKATGSGEL
jgi:hypothetical protein